MRSDKKTSIAIIYGSSTGNTENVAFSLRNLLKDAHADIVLHDVRLIAPEKMRDFDLIIMGCSTWSEGDLQMDFMPFAEDMRRVDLTEKKAAVFGTGEKLFAQHFCTAADTLEKKLKDCGAEMIVPTLKIDIPDLARREQIEAWAADILNTLKKDKAEASQPG